MKNINILIAAIFITSIGYARSTAHFSGKITNPTGKTVYLRQTKVEAGKRISVVLDFVKLTADNSFKLNVELAELTEVFLHDGDEMCPLLLKGGDDLYLSLNTKMFDETIVYSGKGYVRNNAIKNLSLMTEVALNSIWTFEKDADTTQIYMFMDKSFNVISGVIEDWQNEIPDFKIVDAHASRPSEDMEALLLELNPMLK